MTHSKEVATHAKVLRNYGQTGRYHHPRIGLNSRLDELQATILTVRLEWLSLFTKRREEIAEVYFKEINNHRIQFLSSAKNEENHVYHLFVLLRAKRHFEFLFE